MTTKIKIAGFLSSLFILVFMSCKDEIEKHYDVDESVTSGYSLMDMIEQESDLSSFASLLKETGYDAVLRRTQTYTVWAPVNDALSQMSTTDKEEVINLIGNHIARFTHSASGELDKRLYMLNEKRIPFRREGRTFLFGDVELVRPNIKASNGILHVIKGTVPFKQNTWQYMQAENLDSIRKYLYSFNEKTFLSGSSPVIDINNEGLTVYDSVFQVSNIMWNTSGHGAEGIGALNNEDSVYTMILPTNEAWIKAYNAISPYYLSADKSNHPYPNVVDSLQRINTQYAIVRDLVFRGLYNTPESLGVGDSIVSTRQSVFYDPAYLFQNTTNEETSNGIIYKTNDLKYKALESWHIPVLVEAEKSSGRDDTGGNIIAVNTYYDNGTIPISNNRFIEVVANSPSTASSVVFEIPSTLAASYNIYCVFVPFNYKQKKTRIQYQITELRWKNTNGKWTQSSQSLKIGTPSDNVTNPSEMTKMLLVPNFKFPYANVDRTNVTIRIKIVGVKASSSEDIENKFTNDMRIDCLLLEPVQ